MALTAIFLLPPPANTSLPTILSHITLTFPCASPSPFNLTHHLYASTSSLLPEPANPWPPTLYSRPYLSVLTLPPSTSHAPDNFSQPTTFITTSHPLPLDPSVPSPGPPPVLGELDYNDAKVLLEREKPVTEKYERDRSEYALKVEKYTSAAIAAIKYDVMSIKIPAAEQAAFLELLGMKMTPLWAARGTERVDNGNAISLRGGEWILRIGELRQETRKGGSAAGAVRGVLCEITWMEGERKVGEAVGKEDEGMVRAFLERLLDGTGVKLDAARTVVGYTSFEVSTRSAAGKQTNWALAELYTELLRSRG